MFSKWYGLCVDFKDLNRITFVDKVLRDKAFTRLNAQDIRKSLEILEVKYFSVSPMSVAFVVTDIIFGSPVTLVEDNINNIIFWLIDLLLAKLKWWQYLRRTSLSCALSKEKMKLCFTCDHLVFKRNNLKWRN